MSAGTTSPGAGASAGSVSLLAGGAGAAAGPATTAATAAASHWTRICAVEDIVPDTGVAALVGGRQIAIFRVSDGVHAIGNHDPASGVNVLSRGLVGDLGGELVVASPIYKQHYSLITGRCLEEAGLNVPTYLTRIAEGQIWVQGQPSRPRPQRARRRLVVVGNGMAAMRAVEELLELAPNACEITVFGAEPYGSYNRILLSPLLAGAKRVEDVITHPPAWYAERGITLHTGDPIERIDRVRRCVISRSGRQVEYDRLLVATGSQPVVLPVPGKDLAGVLTFRDLHDVDAMLDGARSGRRAVIIGGGLLGLEAAHGLQLQGMDVTVVHLGPYLMERQLDAEASALLRAELECRAMKFELSAKTEAILGEERVTGVRLADGRELAADLVVMAVGVRPNVELARAAGLACDRGILVDDTMATYDPTIYSVGECVQHRNKTFGLVAPLWDQASVCAAHLAERGVRRYRNAQFGVQLKVSGIDVFSAGDYSDSDGAESLVLRDPRRGIYKRLVIEGNRLRGVVLYGDTRDGSWYFELINDRRDIAAMRRQLLFGAVAADAVAAQMAGGTARTQ